MQNIELTKLAQTGDIGVIILAVFLVLTAFIIMLRSISKRDKLNNETHVYVADTMRGALEGVQQIVQTFHISNTAMHERMDTKLDMLIEAKRATMSK